MEIPGYDYWKLMTPEEENPFDFGFEGDGGVYNYDPRYNGEEIHIPHLWILDNSLNTYYCDQCDCLKSSKDAEMSCPGPKEIPF